MTSPDQLSGAPLCEFLTMCWWWIASPQMAVAAGDCRGGSNIVSLKDSIAYLNEQKLGPCDWLYIGALQISQSILWAHPIFFIDYMPSLVSIGSLSLQSIEASHRPTCLPIYIPSGCKVYQHPLKGHDKYQREVDDFSNCLILPMKYIHLFAILYNRKMVRFRAGFMATIEVWVATCSKIANTYYYYNNGPKSCTSTIQHHGSQLQTTRLKKHEIHLRIFEICNWSKLDIWFRANKK